MIEADGIHRELLAPIHANKFMRAVNPMYHTFNSIQLKKGYGSLKIFVEHGVGSDHIVPSMSATLECLKYQSSTALPTSFYEAELDYFGKHMYDKKGDDPGG